MPYEFCSDDFKAQSYWWDASPRSPARNTAAPRETDVLVIGAGYTGLHCALQTATAGRATTVIDSAAAGWGCSTRNGGQISGEIKPSYDELRRRFGHERAFALVDEARQALEWLEEFIRAEQIDCDYRRCGRFLAAHNPRRFRQLERYARSQPAGLEQDLRLLTRAQQAEEIDSPYYHGGLVIDRHASLDPARYHQGLLQRAQENGVRVVEYCQALRIERNGNGFRVGTTGGEIDAREVVVATNGYTGKVAAWQRRRVIPIGSYMLATEEIDPQLADSLMPRQRVFSDTRRIVVYFRRSPDGRRVLFGGRVSVFETDPVKSLPALRKEMLRIFPQLGTIRISHTWMGFVAYTFDALPHLGEQDGIHYAMGYCGSGICLASYLGNRIGLKLAGRDEWETAFAGPRFQSRPLYSGKPWFLAGAVRYYQFLDRYR